LLQPAVDILFVVSFDGNGYHTPHDITDENETTLFLRTLPLNSKSKT
jgi:hypothetical protein